MPPTLPSAPRVLVAGGGVAGVECVLGLHDLAGDRVELTLLADRPDLHYRPLVVGEPFGGAAARRYALAAIAADTGARLVEGTIARFEPSAHAVTTAEGEHLSYDVLIVALGAAPAPPAGDVIDPSDAGALAALRDEVRAGTVRRLALVLPPGPHWMLPGYELALLLAGDARGALDLTLVTAEPAPLALFGPEPSRAVAGELEAAGVRLICDAEAVEALGLDLDRVVVLPELRAPAMPGLPVSAGGFLAVDAHGRVEGAPDVYAAGDCTDSPVKQGGLAAQQADAVVEHVAARAGADVEPRPLHPVLRGRLLTGGEPTWLRRDATDPDDPGDAAHHALWWPPDKIAGRWLAPYLAALDDAAAGVPHAAAHGRRVSAPVADTPVPRHLDLLGDPPAPDARRP